MKLEYYFPEVDELYKTTRDLQYACQMVSERHGLNWKSLNNFYWMMRKLSQTMKLMNEYLQVATE